MDKNEKEGERAWSNQFVFKMWKRKREQGRDELGSDFQSCSPLANQLQQQQQQQFQFCFYLDCLITDHLNKYLNNSKKAAADLSAVWSPTAAAAAAAVSKAIRRNLPLFSGSYYCALENERGDNNRAPLKAMGKQMAPCPHKTDSISACVLSVWSWNTHTSTLRELGREAVNEEREKEEKSRKRQEVESDSGEKDVKRRSKR